MCNPPKCPHGKIPSECTVCNPSEVGKPTSSDFSYPSSVNFGTLEKNASSSSRTQTFTIKNKSDYEMKLSYSTPSGYSISGLPSSLTAGSSSTVTVQLNSASSTGNYDIGRAHV